MRNILLPLFILALTACSKTAPTDTVDSLVAHPDHLREVERQCANHATQMPAAECEAASEARHRLFYGNGPQYTPPKNQPKF